MFKLLLLFLHFYTAFSIPFLKSEEQCQVGCHEIVDGKINVHLVPHSHDDVGWLRTYEEYYEGTGSFTNIADAGVVYILNSTIKALSKNPDRRFIQVETAFFWRWWKDQPDETRELVKTMVNKGQLEIINGGWSMNDEAASHYHSIIDQFTWGFRILEDTVGKCGRPKIGWQIDPFGHSREHASILKQMGFEGLVVGRLDYRDKEKRIAEKNLDFMWNTNDNFDEENSLLFTTMFPDFYVYESGFCFDTYCGSIEINDDNLEQKVKAFTESIEKYKEYYKTSNIMLPMGHDFAYQEADKNFDNIDRLIAGFKDSEKYNVIYSTPSCYIQAVKDEVSKNKIELTVKNDDFFPYASDNHAFWTGYFSSRPTSKRFERTGNNILQSAKQLTTISRINGNEYDMNILNLRMAMGVLQHHDAITGTEKQHVADDYSALLTRGIGDTEEPMSHIIGDLLKKDANAVVDLKLSYCLRANVSICDNSRNDRFLVTVHNPLSRTVSHYVRLPVDGENYKITGPEEDGDTLFDIFDTISSFDYINDGEKATKELVFLANEIPPLGVKLYYVEKTEGSDAYHKFEDIGDQTSFGDQTTNGFTIDANGKLESVTLNGKKVSITQDFYFYKGSTGDTENFRASGAYVFRPDGSELPVSDKPEKVLYAKGTLLDQVLQVFDDEVTQIIRIYSNLDEAYVEFDWLVGDLQVDTKGKEIITRFNVKDNFKNKGIFYTDSNGRQQMKRVKDTRNDYQYNATEEPASSNYYPITSRIVIKDETQKLEVAVLNDRPQGGSSLSEGAIELMVHRRDKKDDGFGVDEVLDEQQYGKGLFARGQHYLTFGEIKKEALAPVVFEKSLAQKKLLAPVVMVADATSENMTLENLQQLLNFKFEALKKQLPDNVQILTLEPWKDSYILRLEHIYEKDDDATLSANATIDLKGLFSAFEITELYSVPLGANADLNKKMPVLKNFWQTIKLGDTDLNVTLKPMEIKTFIFKTDKNNNGGHDNGLTSGTEHLKSFVFLIVLVLSMYLL